MNFSRVLLLLTGCATLCRTLTFSVLQQLIKEPGQAKLIPSAWNASPLVFPWLLLFSFQVSAHMSAPPRGLLTTHSSLPQPLCSICSPLYFLHGTYRYPNYLCICTHVSTCILSLSLPTRSSTKPRTLSVLFINLTPVPRTVPDLYMAHVPGTW